MPKKDKKSSKKKDAAALPRDPADVVDAVRGAVERTFQATAGGTEGARDRGRSLLDDVASAAQRIRESFDDLRVLEDVRGLRTEIEALSRRVSVLEKQVAKPAAAAAETAPAKPAATKSAAARSAASKPAATKSATKPASTRRAPAKRATAAKSGTRKAPAKPSAAGTAAKSTGPKPKPAASRRKPAASSGGGS